LFSSIKEGQYRVFNGNRDIQSLTEFIAEKKWKDIEPSSSWLTPNSFLIKMLSLLFKATLVKKFKKNVFLKDFLCIL